MLSVSASYSNEFSSFNNSAQQPRGRKPGDLRLAVTAVIEQGGPVTLRDLCEQIQATPSTLASTVNNMVRDGRLVKWGMERRAHSKRWVGIYDAPESTYTPAQTPTTALQSAMSAWASF